MRKLILLAACWLGLAAAARQRQARASPSTSTSTVLAAVPSSPTGAPTSQPPAWNNSVPAYAYNESFVHFDCGAHAGQAPPEFLKLLDQLHKNSTSQKGSLAARAAQFARQSQSIAVDLVFHVVSSTAKNGQILPTMPTAQVAAMNAAYAPYGISFNLINTTWTVNDAWAVGEDADMNDMKTALRQGTYNTLNIYFHTDLTGGILGTCTLPSDIGDAPVDPSTYSADGCNVQANTMPGGTVLGYNQGMTAVHETGHWMGLLHVFEGYACDGDGDFISDTVPQSKSTSGCPDGPPPPQSCPNAGGPDNIHNIMDYSTDACYTGFTPLQQARMNEMWGTYRQGR